MTRAEKTAAVEYLKEQFGKYVYFYLTDASKMTVEQVTNLRRKCFESGIQMKVVKNTLAIKALESAAEESNYAELYDHFKGPTAIMFTESANVPARMIRDFRKSEKLERPILKAAYIETAVFVGNDQLESLADLKSKDELVGEVVALLQSPAKNLVSALQSGGQTIMGLLKALEERA